VLASAVVFRNESKGEVFRVRIVTAKPERGLPTRPSQDFSMAQRDVWSWRHQKLGNLCQHFDALGKEQ